MSHVVQIGHRAQLGTTGPPTEVTQRECEELSAKMLRQSQVNDDLEQKLAHAKAIPPCTSSVQSKQDIVSWHAQAAPVLAFPILFTMFHIS